MIPVLYILAWAMVMFFLVVVLTGCASLGMSPYLGMDAAEIQATARIKDAAAGCLSAKGAGYSITHVYVNTDKGMLSSAEISPDCSVKFGADLPPRPRPGWRASRWRRSSASSRALDSRSPSPATCSSS